MSKLMPHQIEKRSMEIIEGLLPDIPWTPEQRAVVKRIVHTCGDPGISPLVRFHPAAIAAGISALIGGAQVYTDVHMARIGMNKSLLHNMGGACHCVIDDLRIVEQSKASKKTRASIAMRTFGADLDGNIVVIGNAPTALREVLALAEEGLARPALVIGMPVGFVDAAESKDALMASDLVYISIEGTRGGSPLAAATINALLRLAEATLKTDGE